MKARYIMAALLLVVAGLQTTKAQKMRFHYAGQDTPVEYSLAGLDSMVFVDAPAAEPEYVDLGLPSGTLWATFNVGASCPEDYGDYFAWGETTTKEEYSWSTYKYCEGSETTFTKYCSSSDYGYNGFTDNLKELLPEDDAATENWGSEWQMPSQSQLEELFNDSYTTTEWTTQNGVYGRKITSRSNGKAIFLPAAGYREGTSLDFGRSFGYYWSRSLSTSDPGCAYRLYLSSSNVGTSYYDGRDLGFSVRPVRKQEPKEVHEYVDLGLPSGTLWATCNVGAESPEDYGDYFAWGETKPKEDYDWFTYEYCEGFFNTLTKYCLQSDYGYRGFRDGKPELFPEDDAATENWGSEWQMPYQEQFEELINNSYTTTEWTKQNGIYGCKITSKTNGKTIFLPAAGYWEGTSLGYVGSGGYYWSRTLDSYSYGALRLYFDSSDIETNGRLRCVGQSVRPVRKQAPKEVLVESITLNETELRIELPYENEVSRQLTATILPSNATNKTLEWESSNEAVAKVSANGRMTAVGWGNCIITCRATDGSGVYAECRVKVVDPVL
jgi:hypothetical protein